MNYRTLVIGGLVLGLASSASAFSEFVSDVPNGNVFSCATCHVATGFGRNSFGRDFGSAGESWSGQVAGVALPNIDSDGDGFANGVELGDPDGDGTPTAGAQVTNPGDAASRPSISAPTITTHPVSQTVTEGADVTFTVAASGTGPLSYQWQRNGNNINGATTTALALDNVTEANEGAYRAVVSNAGGSTPSNPATLTVNPAAAAPSITQHPQNRTATEGEDVTFQVQATGTAPLSYQWQRNMTDIPGATTATLTLDNVTEANEGSYRAVVSNSAGSATSNPATLTVNAAATAPSITQHPQNRTVTEGEDVTFQVQATGTGPLSYQWQRNMTDIPGATTATLTLDNVTEANEGSYRAVVSNSAGSATSNPAMLTVNAAAVVPVITQHPESRNVDAGEDVTFQVAATGTAPLAYQWQRNGTDLPGATAPVLRLDNVTEADEGSYRAVVSNSAGSATSDPATLTVEPVVAELSVDLTSPQNGQVYTAPANIVLEADVTSSQPVTMVEFFVGTTLLDTITEAPYEALLEAVPAGEYSLTARVTDADGNTATSDTLSVRVVEPGANQPPVIEMLTPRDGGKFGARSRILLSALAYDLDGTVVSVEFFDGETSLGFAERVRVRDDDEDDDEHDGDDEGESDDEEDDEDDNGTSKPQMAVYFLNAGTLTPGEHILTAQATDNAGAVTTAEPVTITVKAPKMKPTNKRWPSKGLRR